ncbi:hypothetical protein ACFOOM_09930 [Streptomyces echinoruber]|uniref:hypothetical protein n=1 Tax=Streptomyces echinoruber TaxID=68898 RepID=UPI00360EEA7A
MIRAQLTPDGRAVEIPLDQVVARVLDDLAVAYADDPDTVGALLAEHASAVLHRQHVAASPTASDTRYEFASAAADHTREAITDEIDAEASAPIRLDQLAARRLADRLVALASRLIPATRTEKAA